MGKEGKSVSLFLSRRGEKMDTKVLMVDDEAAILLFYKAELDEAGFNVITASNSERALDLFETEKPDIVTLDMVMPEIIGGRLKSAPHPVGVRLLMKMKEMKKSTPVIMLSAYDLSEKMENIPSDGYVMKSADTTELKTVLRKIAAQTGGNGGSN